MVKHRSRGAEGLWDIQNLMGQSLEQVAVTGLGLNRRLDRGPPAHMMLWFRSNHQCIKKYSFESNDSD